jgi:hypothetical protein
MSRVSALATVVAVSRIAMDARRRWFVIMDAP